MITLPVEIVDGSACIDWSLVPSDAISIVIDTDKATVYQAGDDIPT